MNRLSKAKIKFIAALATKKYRQRYGMFAAEGVRLVTDLFSAGYDVELLVYTDQYIGTKPTNIACFHADDDEMRKISQLKTPSPVLAVVRMRANALNFNELQTGLTIAADDIQDPGNLGTIVRLCDWYGINNMVCSLGSVDIYNPKVVQATMGAFVRVSVHYVDLPAFVCDYRRHTGNACFGTFLSGDNIYASELPASALLVVGNEGNGISAAVAAVVDRRLHIPAMNDGRHIESLNISTATAIACSEFCRKQLSTR